MANEGKGLIVERVVAHRLLAVLLAALIALAGCTALPAPDDRSGDGGRDPDSGPVDGEGRPAPTPLDDVPQPPALVLDDTAQALIERALADGQIDEPTSLLYRAWALTGDERLPDGFRGEGSTGHDPALFDIIVDEAERFPPEVASELGRLLLRPTDPDSAWTLDAELMARLPIAATSVANGSMRPCPPDAWIDSGDASPHFKVWACTHIDDASAAAHIETARRILDEVYGPMTQAPPAGMGSPKDDDGDVDAGGDKRIDVYLLHPGWGRYRHGELQRVSGAVAAAIPAPPFTAPEGGVVNSSSGYILIDRARMGDADDLRRSLIHEFFHVLQMAHHRKTRNKTTNEYHWYREATATWAETYYYRAQSGQTHDWFTRVYDSTLSLSGQAGNDAAYIWPFFVEQALGASSIFSTWQQIGAVPPYDLDAVTKVIDANSPFEDHFGEFALRNLNKHLQAGDPLKPRYVELDRNFPDGVALRTLEAAGISSGDGFAITRRLPSLSANHIYFLPDHDVADVTFDLRGLTPNKAVSAIAVFRVNGKWERRTVDAGLLRLCRTNKAEEFDQLYLVIANRSHDPATTVAGDIEVLTHRSCGDLVGTIRYEVRHVYSDPALHNTQSDYFASVVLSVRFDERDGAWVDAGSTYSFRGHHNQSSQADSCFKSDSRASWSDSGSYEGRDDVGIDVDVDMASREVWVGAVVNADMSGHKTWSQLEYLDGSDLDQTCVTHDEDFAQGRSEWYEEPSCEGGLIGRLSDDGRTATFACSQTATEAVNTGSETSTWTVSGTLTFTGR